MYNVIFQLGPACFKYCTRTDGAPYVICQGTQITCITAQNYRQVQAGKKIKTRIKIYQHINSALLKNPALKCKRKYLTSLTNTGAERKITGERA